MAHNVNFNIFLISALKAADGQPHDPTVFTPTDPNSRSIIPFPYDVTWT